MMWQQIGAELLLLASLGGCTVGPNYRPPQVPVPTTWSVAPPDGTDAHTAMPTQWWTTFAAPMLESLVVRAVQADLDLRMAAARVRAARAQRGVVAAGLWPTSNVSGTYTRRRASEHTGLPVSGEGDRFWKRSKTPWWPIVRNRYAALV
jgi:multidrug efflux system outer membrane protein